MLLSHTLGHVWATSAQYRSFSVPAPSVLPWAEGHFPRLTVGPAGRTWVGLGGPVSAGLPGAGTTHSVACLEQNARGSSHNCG